MNRFDGNPEDRFSRGEAHIKTSYLEQVAKILIRTTPLEEQLDPKGSVASRGRFVRTSVKNMLMTKNKTNKKRFQDPALPTDDIF